MAGVSRRSDQTKKILLDYEVDSEIIDIEDLVYVNACMVDLADHWVRLGECLGMTEAKLGIIRAQNPDHDVRKCLVEMLADWLNNDLEPTWTRIVIAIATAVGDEDATKVAEKLQSGTNNLITACIPGLDVDSVDSSILDRDAFPDIISALHTAEVTKRWLDIGLFLGITYGKLETLKTKSDDEKVRGVVGFWMRWNYDYGTFGKPSWKSLVRAIGARAGGNARRAAKKIAADHAAAPSAKDNCEMSVEDESWEYTTLSKNAGPLTEGLSTFNIARTLSDELKDAGVIGNVLRDQAYVAGAGVTERMRVRPIIDGMLTKVRQNKARYKEFRDVLLKVLGNDKDAVEPFIPAPPSPGQ